MTAVLTVGGLDMSPATIYDVSLTVGRDDVNTQPDASVLDATLHVWNVGTVGDPVTLVDAAGALFTGTLTDLETTPIILTVPSRWETKLTAVGPLADLGRVLVGDEPWPQETDSERVWRIVELAGAPHAVDPNVLGPQILARDVDAQNAADLCRDVATDALGVFWEQPADPDTPIRYSPQRYRSWNAIVVTWDEVPQSWDELNPAMTWADATSDYLPIAGVPLALELDAGEVRAEVVFSQRVGDLVRKARVVYGPDTGEAGRDETGFGAGTPEVKLDTQLADEGDALNVAETVVRSRREPKWRLSNVVLDQDHAPPIRWLEIRRQLTIGTRLTLTLPTDSPVGAIWQGYLEGWDYQLLPGDGDILTLRTSERALSEPADRWQDLNPALTWAAVQPEETWDTAQQLEGA
jgi:hypothetical protein